MTALARVAVACDLCGDARHTPVHALQRSAIVHCQACGFAYVSPRLSSEGLQTVLQEWSQRDVVDAERLRVAFEPGTLAYYGRYMQLLARHRVLPGKRLLDIGCATGALLSVARDAGWSVSGIEIGQAAAAYARDTLKIDVRTGSLHDVDFGEPFDAVAFLEVIEHLESPRAALRRIHGMLRQDGLLLLSTPNYDSLYRRLFGARWWVVNCEDEHIMLFTPDSLQRALASEGFEVLHMGIRSMDFLGMLRCWRRRDRLVSAAQTQPEHGYYASRDAKERVKHWLRRSGLLALARAGLRGLDWFFSRRWSPLYAWGEQLVVVARRREVAR